MSNNTWRGLLWNLCSVLWFQIIHQQPRQWGFLSGPLLIIILCLTSGTFGLYMQFYAILHSFYNNVKVLPFWDETILLVSFVWPAQVFSSHVWIITRKWSIHNPISHFQLLLSMKCEHCMKLIGPVVGFIDIFSEFLILWSC